ncbi:MAG: LysM peptidoglycan-binding domain-containing protein [Spirochaetes bacterium]|nr:LysM peptidoglycan-binding domain-containing protein [Spirochaetota bacterium]
MIENPAERVFHIDGECYLIYLGSSHTEYRPFLRIGNSAKLPEEIKKYVSTVLVTDNYTGNPFLEHENVELPLNGETRFVGDPVRIERLKQFLNEKNLPVAEFEYETVESPPQKGKSIVFFFKNGNLHVHHNGDELFNLRQREAEDLHFVYLAERVSSFVKDNPLRYLARVFQNPGFILLGQQIYFFHEGRLGVVHVPKDFLWSLSRAGIDPDMLQWCIEEQFEEGILQKLKRSVAIKKEFRVASHRIEQLRSIINLFSGMDTSLFAIEPDASGCFHLQGFRFCGEGGSVEFPSPFGIAFNLSSGFSHERNNLQKALENKGLPIGTRILGNIPYRFHSSPLPSPLTLLATYGVNIAKNCAEVGNLLEQDWWRMMVSTLNLIQEQWKKGSPRISSFESLEPLLIRELPLNEMKAVIPYLIWNLETLSRSIDPSNKGTVWERWRRKAKNSFLYQLPEDREGCIPFVGDFWVFPNGMHLFYQIEGRLTPLKLLQANKSIENIDKIRTSLKEETFFVQERDRLLRFLEHLHQVPPKRVKRAVGTQPATTASFQSPTSNLSHTEPRSPQPSTQQLVQPKSTPSLATPSSLSSPTPPFPMRPSKDELGGAVSKGESSEDQKIFIRGWGLYLLGGLFLSGLMVALWQFDLFPHGIGRSTSTTQTLHEQSIAPNGTSGKSESLKQEEDKTSTTTKTDEPIGKGNILLKAGEPSEGPKEVQVQGKAQLGRDQQDAPVQKSPIAQKGAEEKKEVDAFPSTYTANIPPLGNISITVMDVFYLVNEIADANGYRRLDSPKDLRPDPNWIYPGNQFKLPDSSLYVVKRGDTLWGITTRYIEQEVAKGIGILKLYLGPTLESVVPKDKKSELEGVIAGLQQESHCKAFVEYLNSKKKEVVYR